MKDDEICERIGFLISRRQDGELSHAEGEILDAHLSECAACRETADDFCMIAATFSRATEPDVSDALVDGVVRRVRTESRRNAAAHLPGITLMRTVNALAAVLVVMLGAGLIFLHGNLADKTERIAGLLSETAAKDAQLAALDRRLNEHEAFAKVSAPPTGKSFEKLVSERAEFFRQVSNNAYGSIKSIVITDDDETVVPSARAIPALGEILLIDLKIFKTEGTGPVMLFRPQITTCADEDTTLNLKSSARPDVNLSLKILGSKSVQIPFNAAIELKLVKSVGTSDGGLRSLSQELREALIMESGARKVVSQSIRIGDETFEAVIVISRTNFKQVKDRTVKG